MKKLLVILMALAVILTACAQKEAETAAPAEVPAVETPAVETPAVETPAAETPAVEAPAEEAAEAPAEEVPAEAPAETPKTSTDGEIFSVKEGDTITYKGKQIVIEDLTNQGNYITMFIDPIRYHLYAVNKPEILDNIEYTIVENNFNTDNSVKIRIKPLALGENEYLLVKDDSVKVGNATIALSTVGKDSSNQEYAYVHVNGKENWVKLGATIDTSAVSVTVKRVFYKQKQYAILDIVPK